MLNVPMDREDEVNAMFTGFVRTIILYVLIIAGIRLMGKRQVGELEPSELVLSLIIADLAAVPMQDFGIPLLTGVVPILTLLSLTMILSVLTMKSVRFRALMCGRPSVIIRKGKIEQGEMRRNRLTVDELLEELRAQGYPGPAGIEYAILETNGQLSVLPWAREQPPTQSQLGMEVQESGLPLVIISDGRLLARNLTVRGYDEVWLKKQLDRQGLKSSSQVFLMTVDEVGEVYLAPKEIPKERGRRCETAMGRGSHSGGFAGGHPVERLVRPTTDRGNDFTTGAGSGADRPGGLGGGRRTERAGVPKLAGP